MINATQTPEDTGAPGTETPEIDNEEQTPEQDEGTVKPQEDLNPDTQEPRATIKETSNEPAPQWFDGIAEENRSVTEKYDSVDAIAKALINAQALASKKGLTVPGADADAETVAAYNKAIGVPESAADYKVEIPESLAEYVGEGKLVTPEHLDNLKQELHTANLNQDQFQKVSEAFVQEKMRESSSSASQADEVGRQTEAALGQKWGDQFESNMEVVNDVAQALGINNILVEKGLHTDQTIIEKLFSISSQFDESTLQTGRPTMKTYADRYASLVSQISSNKVVKGSKQHKALKAQLDELTRSRMK